MRIFEILRLSLCLSLLAGCATPPAAPATRALLEPAAPTTRLTQIGDHFSSARKWFGMVSDLEFDVTAGGERSPRFESLSSDLVRRRDGAGQTLRVVTPARATGAHLVGIAGEDEVWVRATEPALEDVPAEVVNGVVIYRGALAGGDLLYKFTPTHQDEYVYFESPPEKLVRRVNIERGPAIVELRQTRKAVEVIDRDGAARLRVGAPYARAADGTTRRGTIRVDGDTLVLEIDLRGLPAPILVDPDWSTTGTMTVGHWANSAWLLPDGDALVAGGCALAGCPSSFARPTCGTVLADTEIWDHGTGTWRAGPPLAAARFDFAEVDLGAGNALVMGGCVTSECGSVTDVAERYDAAAESFTSLPPLSSARGHVVGALLPGGDALAIGGCNETTCLDTVDRYQASDSSIVAAPALGTARGFATATVLSDGRVLVAGGCADPACAAMVAEVEVYDPAADAFSSAGVLDTPRAGHTATLMDDGKVLIAGGCADAECMRTLATTEIWDPATGLVAAGPAMPGPRHNHTASLLPTGEVVLAGGAAGPTTSLPSAVVYVPSGERFIELEHMVLDRAYHTAIALSSSDVLVAGGCNPTTCMPWAEIFSPARLPELLDGGVPDAGGPVDVDAGPAPPAPTPRSVHPAAYHTGVAGCADDEYQNLRCLLDTHPMQDADFAPNDLSFEAQGADLVSAATGLSWVAAEDETEYTQADAMAHCAGLSTADAPAGSYRLPTVVELATLIDSGEHEPAMDPLFVGAAADGYWSSTPVVSGTTQGWTVRFDFGELVPALATHALRARCVRGDFVGVGARLHQGGPLVATGGTLVDEEGGLEWQRVSSDSRQTWSEALRYCASQEIDGKTGFHLPNANELRGLLDYGATTPVRADPIFDGLRGDTYWSSTPTYGIPSLAQAVSFNLGVQDGVSVDSPAYVLCVRHLPVAKDSSGCGCRVTGASQGRGPLALSLSLLLGLGLLWRRRR